MTKAKEKQADDLTGISQTAYNLCWACRHADQNYARSGTDGNHKHVQRAWADLRAYIIGMENTVKRAKLKRPKVRNTKGRYVVSEECEV